MDPALSTEKPSRASENISHLAKESSRFSRFQKGRRSEEFVAQSLVGLGFEILGRNWRTPYGEVDLVASRDEELWILEVKTQSFRYLGKRNPLSYGQKDRLGRAAKYIWLRERKNFEKFRCQLVIVTERGMKWITLPLLYDQA